MSLSINANVCVGAVQVGLKQGITHRKPGMYFRLAKYWLMLAFFLIQTSTSQAADKDPLQIYAAGSLRNSLDEILEQFKIKTGINFKVSYGPSGKWREEIESGQHVDVFASASMEHTDALFQKGILKNSTVFAHNSLCLLAAPGIDIGSGNLLERMLDPGIRLGTSTPKTDPAGDYTWQLFHKAEKIQPGAYEQLDRKALKLVGKSSAASGAAKTVTDLLRNHEIDLFVTYCSYAAQTASQVPKVTWQPFPDELNVEASYGIGATPSSGPNSDKLISFILGPEGQKILINHGFEGATH